MSLAYLGPAPVFQAFDANGDPLPGALLYTYVSGTSTPLATYQDQDGTVPHANPIVCDANGEAVIYFQALAYRLTLKSAAGVTQPNYPQDNYYAQSTISQLGNSTDAAQGDALVAVKAAWTGAGARTQHSRNADQIFATDAVVYKNIDTSSTAGLQNALNAAAGGELIIPPGIYKIKATGLIVPSNTHIYAYGATLDASDGHRTILTFAGGGGIYGATIIGAASGTYDAAGIGVYCSGTVTSAITPPNMVAGPTIRDCTFKNIGSFACLLKYCTNPIVEHCTFNDIGYICTDFVSCTNFRWCFNYVDTVTPGTNDNAYGIGTGRDMGSSSVGQLVGYPRTTGGLVFGNYISNIPIWEAMDTHGGDRIKFIGNKVVNCLIGCALVSTHYGSTNDAAPLNCEIIGNDFECLYGNTAINVAGAYNSPTVTEYSTGVRIIGNRIVGGGITNDNSYGSIRCYATRDMVIQGNSIVNSKMFGIILSFENNNFVISGNTFVDPHDDTLNYPSAIGVRALNNKGIITNNSIELRNGSIGTYVCKNAVWFNSSGVTGSKILIGKNLCINMTNAGPNILFAGGSKPAGVDISGCWAEVGSVNIPLALGGSSGEVDVTFAAVYPSAPRVFSQIIVSPLIGGPAAIVSIPVADVTATGFKAIAYPVSGTWTGNVNLAITYSVIPD